MKKITLHSEALYILANILMALAVAMTAASDFGVSMIVAPAYILHLKIGFLTFGQCEYLVQGLLFIVFCILMKKVRLIYFSAFITSLIYGACLDLWRWAVPAFNPAVTPSSSLSIPTRVVFFVVGEILTALAVAVFFKIYLYPQVVDFFVKGVAERFHLNLTRFKWICDASMLVISAVLSLAFFRGFVGIGWGTLVLTATNSLVIGAFSRLLDRTVEVKPLFPKFATLFAI